MDGVGWAAIAFLPSASKTPNMIPGSPGRLKLCSAMSRHSWSDSSPRRTDHVTSNKQPVEYTSTIFTATTALVLR